MTTTLLPTTRELRELLAEEARALGGTLPDVFDDGERLFARAVLPAAVEVRPRDRVRGGVAMRVVGEEVLVHPYTFRLVCSNGAMVAHALQARRVTRAEFYAPTEVVAAVGDAVRGAVRACASAEAFAGAAREMRSALEVQADIMLHLLPMLSRLPQHVAAQALPHILGRFEGGRDRSAFGLMNAVTSVARDTRDPEARWRLEELGGAVPARLQPRPRVAPDAVVLTA